MKPKPAVEKTVLSFRVTPEIRKAIEAAAVKERRPVSHWLEIHIENYLKNHNPEQDMKVLTRYFMSYGFDEKEAEKSAEKALNHYLISTEFRKIDEIPELKP